MTQSEQDLEALGARLETLAQQSSDAESTVTMMTRSLEQMRRETAASSTHMKDLSKDFGRSIKGAFDGIAFDGQSLSDALKDVSRSLSKAAYDHAMKPVQEAVGGTMAAGLESFVGAVLPFAKGGAFSSGRVNNGIVEQASAFPMRDGTGLMGEAGAEAIMPLTRGSDGKLGVALQGGSAASVTVHMNIQTPDVAGFRRSKTQVAAEMSRALSAAQRNR